MDITLRDALHDIHQSQFMHWSVVFLVFGFWGFLGIFGDFGGFFGDFLGIFVPVLSCLHLVLGLMLLKIMR